MICVWSLSIGGAIVLDKTEDSIVSGRILSVSDSFSGEDRIVCGSDESSLVIF